MKRNFLNYLLGLFFPARCPVCDTVTQQYTGLCENCETSVERIKDQCHSCGREKSECMCARSKFNLQITAPFVYKDGLAETVRRFKFDDETQLCDFFASEISASVRTAFPENNFDFVTCVPLTKKKLNKRGYNQSELLAKNCANQLGTVYNNVLVKTRETADQHSLKADARLKNLKDAFAVSDKADIKGKTVLLCDDVKTTGATLYECRKTLVKAGAKEVCCACIAVVPEKIINE